MARILTEQKLRKPQRGTFNLSYQNILTAKMGTLTPFMMQEILPGDSFKVGENHLIRLAPTLAPIMSNVNVFFHYFFVPNRLVWDEWEDFITTGPNGNLSPHKPKLILNTSTSFGCQMLKHGSLADYLNFPTFNKLGEEGHLSGRVELDALPFRAYQLVYNEYYRDQNVMGEIPIPKDSLDEEDDNNLAPLMALRSRCWSHDYFTSALPWPQRNAKGVPIPITGSARTYADPGPSRIYDASNTQGVDSIGTLTATQGELRLDGQDKLRLVTDYHVNANEFNMPTVTEFRRALRLQEWFERSAVGGSRYIEQILAHFGVRSSDARLQRPEYLCGIKSPVVVTEVQATSNSTLEANGSKEVTPLGTLGGNGTSVASNFAFSRNFEEHGFLIGIMSIVPKASYYQGMPRKYTRDTWDKYYWPEFANIGEQAISNEEIFFDPSAGDNVNKKEWGYIPRYAEYRLNQNEVHGEFRSNMDFWHLGRKFQSLPPLNSDFLKYDESNANRIFVVEEELANPFYCEIYNQISANRLIPEFAETTI